MIVAQLLLAGAGFYEQKSQRIDAETLEGRVVFTGDRLAADLAHLYGPRKLPGAAVRGIGVPYIASGRPARRRLPFGRVAQPRAVVSPLKDGGGTYLPEAVDGSYFDAAHAAAGPPFVIGTLLRPGVLPVVELVRMRIERFRDDVEWRLFEAPPAAPEMASLAAWVDPAVDEEDFDGWVAEALACGVPAVAARTAINIQRLENGRCGTLVPPRDPNEITHAILTALFKPELRMAKAAAARQTVARFRPRQRARILEQLYETIR